MLKSADYYACLQELLEVFLNSGITSRQFKKVLDSLVLKDVLKAVSMRQLPLVRDEWRAALQLPTGVYPERLVCSPRCTVSVDQLYLVFGWLRYYGLSPESLTWLIRSVWVLQDLCEAVLLGKKIDRALVRNVLGLLPLKLQLVMRPDMTFESLMVGFTEISTEIGLFQEVFERQRCVDTTILNVDFIPASVDPTSTVTMVAWPPLKEAAFRVLRNVRNKRVVMANIWQLLAFCQQFPQLVEGKIFIALASHKFNTETRRSWCPSVVKTGKDMCVYPLSVDTHLDPVTHFLAFSGEES